MRQRWERLVPFLAVLFALVLALAGCSAQTTPSSTATETAVPVTPTDPATATPVDPTSLPCGYTWATKRLAEVTSQLQEAFNAAGLKDAVVWAEGYGENCVDTQGQVQSFHAMETDFHIRMPVSSLEDLQAVGDLLQKMLKVLDGFPPDQVPGSQPGYIGVELNAGQDVQNLWFKVSEGTAAREQGLQGAALYEALLNP